MIYLKCGIKFSKITPNDRIFKMVNDIMDEEIMSAVEYVNRGIEELLYNRDLAEVSNTIGTSIAGKMFIPINDDTITMYRENINGLELYIKKDIKNFVFSLVELFPTLDGYQLTNVITTNLIARVFHGQSSASIDKGLDRRLEIFFNLIGADLHEEYLIH